MAQPNPTMFRNDTAIAARAAEVPEADFTNGVNNASCSMGIGINAGGGAVVGTPEQFTLASQFGTVDVADRTPQISQSIGGLPSVPRSGNQEFTWDTSQALYTVGGAASSGGTGGADGTLPEATIAVVELPTEQEKIDAAAAGDSIDGFVTPTGGASLTSLAAGWTSVP
jgi:hypothetical protein